jgi:ATP-dependent Lon protease
MTKKKEENALVSSNAHIPNELPVVYLKDIVMYPRLSAPFAIAEARSLKAVDAAYEGDRMVMVVAQKSDSKTPGPEDLYRMGTVSKVVELMRQPDGTVRIFLEGISRANITRFTNTDPYTVAAIETVAEPEVHKTEKIEALMYSVVNEFKQAVNMGAAVPFDVLLVVMNITDPWQLCDLVAVNMEFKVEEKQGILESSSPEEKLRFTNEAIGRQIKVLNMAKKIQAETGKELGKMEKEMMLREQMKAIEKELGGINGVSEVEELRAKIEKAGMPTDAKEVALKELARMNGMPSFSPEISYLRTYLDWLIQIPWSLSTTEEVNVKKAEKILNDDHYGLEKVKERILEFLSVHKLTGKLKGPILCFAGPPGTGKTSIGKSIARALGRKFVRISLGGVRDEAEIRGFRRTYVGSLPGRIVQGICTAKTKNPVFMLDEIDKLGADAMRGDPSSALLEALDPEQNHAFSDHYVELPVDLSDVMFITTANLLDPVPPALRDRMEVIEFPGYTEEEKFHIAKKYLIPKVLENHGLKGKTVSITDDAVREVVRSYTREAGVRNIERQLATIFRKVARTFAEDGIKSVTVNPGDLKRFLGPIMFHGMEKEKKDEVGVATGLAWTEAGGEILPIEVTKMPGSGKLILTGHLGKVMQESAEAAFSYARALMHEKKSKDTFYKTSDIHVHVPQGAIPKDGPSAGVAIATALYSELTGVAIKRQVAMTGEVTLRGKVLEIGGVKEKVLAAHRAGITTVVLPKDNEKDLEELPEKVRKSMHFLFAETMNDVLKAAMAKPVAKR